MSGSSGSGEPVMRVALVVPVALPCTPRGGSGGGGVHGSGQPAGHAGLPDSHTSATGTTHRTVIGDDRFGEGWPRRRPLRHRAGRNAGSPFAAARFSVAPFEALATAIPTSVRAESEISKAASSRGPAPSAGAKVTCLVAVRAVSRACWPPRRLLVPVTSPCFFRAFSLFDEHQHE